MEMVVTATPLKRNDFFLLKSWIILKGNESSSKQLFSGGDLLVLGRVIFWGDVLVFSF